MEGRDSSTLLARRWELYGPGRTDGRDAAKQLQQEDHVKRNFQKGVVQLHSKEAFETVTSRSFKHTAGSHDQEDLRCASKWNSSTQNVTHLHFGSDSEPYTSVVKSEFTSKPMPKYEHHMPEGINDIHLADMAPKYIADKSFGKSLYNTDFDGANSYKQCSSQKEGRKVGQRLKTTQFQKATHFELGSYQPSLVTETSQCFTSREVAASTSGVVVVDRSRSNVFRPGDYNTPRKMTDHFVSIQQKDFGTSGFLSSVTAGVTTATKKGYFHVIQRKPAAKQAISALRQLLIEKNSKEYINPRDPVAINVMRAFLKYDQDRSGSVSVDELKVVCKELGTPITEEEITELLNECDINGDGMIDYMEFSKYLTDQSVASTDERFISTHSATYPGSSRPTTASDAAGEPFVGVHYQTSTHFQFGNDKELPGSIYKNDYASESARQVTKSQAAPPISSKVMHEFPVFASGSTTNRQDFVQHDVAMLEKQRLSGLLTNKKKLEKLGVVLSCSTGASKEYKTSTMSSSYVSPPSGLTRSKPVDPVPKEYHHLESNRSLPQSNPHQANTDTSTAMVRGQGQSEAKESFLVPIKSEQECVDKRRSALDERTSRIKDNKNTHFFLGFSELPACSEKMVEFGEKAPLNPNLPAAGRPNGPTKGYSVVGHDSGAPADESRPMSSESDSGGLQTLLQQRNFTRNINPRDPLNVNLRKAFLEYDKDLSGTISADEVKAVCKAMNTVVTDKELEQIIARCDKNGDGQIDYHDFALHLCQQQHPPDQVAGKTPATTTRKDFKHPEKQKLSVMQKLVLEQDSKRYVPLQQTHFFHLDSHDEYNLSTTRKDFVLPEQL